MPSAPHIVPGVDIVVPIYNARVDVERCVASVLRHATGDWRLILIDDASTDTELVEFLRRTGETHERVVYIRNDVNGGFVVTANRGMREADGRDVLLLNSDTIVTPRFIEKHVACVYADETTGIASPFTNNGTICSLPEFCRDSELPGDIALDDYAALVEAVSPRSRPEIVTAVGFCMYIRAAVIAQIGLFDEKSFGRGFGEENDFCERAKQRGWRIRLVDDCFIAHMGKASFGDEGRALEHVNSRTLARMHPNYFADVAAFCAANPLRAHQDRVRFELARHSMRRYHAALFVLHAPMTGETAGGTEHFVRGLIESLALPRVVVAWPSDGAIVAMEIGQGDVDAAAMYRFDLPRGAGPFCLRDDAIEAAFERLLDEFDVGFVHIHHLMNWPTGIWRCIAARSIPFAYTIHDYYCVCPSWNLVRRDTGAACSCAGAAEPDETRACLAAQFDALNLPAPRQPVECVMAHRAEFGELLSNAARVFSPSSAAADLVRHHHSSRLGDVAIIGHGYDALAISNGDVKDASGPMRVAILGQVAYPAKGAETYLELMRRTKALPIQWHVFGEIEVYGFRRRVEGLQMGERLVLHGNYCREAICSLLRDARIELALILPGCAETFCFTLSESWLAGVPVIVTRMGALPERVAETGAGIVVDSIDNAMAALESFATDRTQLAPYRERLAMFHHATIAENAARHRTAYASLLDSIESPARAATVEPSCVKLYAAHERELAHRRAAAPAPRYHASWWYPTYLRFKPMIPTRWRGAMKQAYLRMRGARPVRR